MNVLESKKRYTIFFWIMKPCEQQTPYMIDFNRSHANQIMQKSTLHCAFPINLNAKINVKGSNLTCSSCMCLTSRVVKN